MLCEGENQGVSYFTQGWPYNLICFNFIDSTLHNMRHKYKNISIHITLYKVLTSATTKHIDKFIHI
jgi:hypothetical protein